MSVSKKSQGRDEPVDYIRKRAWQWDCLVKMTVYMVSENDYVKIYFPRTPPDEVNDTIFRMRSQGFKECSWIQWIFRKWCMKLVAAWKDKYASEHDAI
jgi:hypothetical protein